MKIAFIGDQHRDFKNFKSVIEYLDRVVKPDLYIQLGDFGFIGENFEHYVELIDDLLTKKMLVIDGNHENHKWIGKTLGTKDSVLLGNNLELLSRGALRNIDGLDFLFVGGAYSIDRKYRIKDFSYWDEELITPEQFEKAMTHGNVDILVTHDVPQNVFDFMLDLLPLDLSNELDRQNRAYLQQIFDKYLPSLIIHGHFHLYYETTLKHKEHKFNAVGVDCNIAYSLHHQYFILDTEKFKANGNQLAK